MNEPSPSEGLYGSELPSQAPQSPKEPPPSLMDQLTGVFTDPVPLFKRLRANPQWVGALGVTLVLTLAMITVWALKVDVDALMRPVLEHNPKLSSEQVDRTIEMMQKFNLPISFIGGLLGVPVMALVAAFVFWLVGRYTAESEAPTFSQALSGSVVAGLVTVPRLLLITFMCAVKPIGGLAAEKIAPTSLGFFLQPEHPKLAMLLFRLDLFTLAYLVMIFLALRHTLRLKTSGATLGVVLAVLGGIVLPALFAR